MSTGASITPGGDPVQHTGVTRATPGGDAGNATAAASVSGGATDADKAALAEQTTAALNPTVQPAPTGDQNANPGGDQAPAEGDQSQQQQATEGDQPKVKDPAEAKSEGDQQQQSSSDDDKAQAEITAKMQPFTDEFASTGDLSAESRAKAAEAFGVTPEMVDAYVKGLQAEGAAAQADVNRVHEFFGGPEAYKGFMSWANEGNLSANEIGIYNSLLDNNLDGALAYAETLRSKYQAAGNQAPRNITRQPGTQATDAAPVAGYKSVAEMKAAMSDPRYAKDPAYRAEVEAKTQAM